MTEPQEPRSAAPQHPTPEELSLYAFSPQEAAAGLREHTEGCAACSAELADLRLVLASLAELPEPELPVEVGIRLDAALARAWQEADAEKAAADAAALRPGVLPARRRLSWRRIAAPLGALSLLALGGAGAGLALSHGSTSSNAPSAASAGSGAMSAGDAVLTQWVRSVLPVDTRYTVEGTQLPSGGVSPHVQSSKRPAATADSGAQGNCSSYPQRPGFQVLSTSERAFEGGPATLVVYQNDQGPASAPVYAVVYAGPCPTSSSQVLDQGYVSR